MQTANERHMSSGLLMIRAGMAISLLIYALPRLIAGTRGWAQVGKEIHFLQADFSAQVIGIIILACETLAALGLLTGYLFRVSATLLAGIYAIYFFNFFNVGYKTLPMYAAVLACVCLGLLLSGPGRFAVAVKIESK